MYWKPKIHEHVFVKVLKEVDVHDYDFGLFLNLTSALILRRLDVRRRLEQLLVVRRNPFLLNRCLRLGSLVVNSQFVTSED